MFLYIQKPSCDLILRLQAIRILLKYIMARDKVLDFRFSAEEVKRLNEKYNKTSFSSLSAYIRFLIFKENVKVSFSSSDDELARQIGERNKRLAELSRQIAMIGNNLNQVAKKVNSQQYVMREDVIDLQRKVESISSLVEKFINFEE